MQRCLQQFAIYIWTKCKPYKIPLFLSEMREYVDFNVNVSQFFGCGLCQMNNHFLLDKPKTIIFYKCLMDFFGKVLGKHIENTLLVDHNHVKMMKGPIKNVMLVEKWNDRVDVFPKYLMGEILHYLVQALHSIGGFKFFRFSCLKNS